MGQAPRLSRLSFLYPPEMPAPPTPPSPSSQPEPTWLTDFTPFTLHHLVIVLFFAALAALVIRLGVTHRGTATEKRIRIAWGMVTLASATGMTIFWFQPERYRPDTSWPLHLCDLAAWLTPYAMLTARRWPRTLLFFWGLGLSSQGFATPTVQDGMDSVGYWLFWTQHLGIVAGGLYLAIVNRYRPTWRDAMLAFASTIALGLAITGFNLAMGTNYMYTGNMTPRRPTLIDHLGPWPARLVWLAALVALAYALTQGATLVVLAVARKAGHAAPRGERLDDGDASPL